MANFTENPDAFIIRHKGESTFYMRVSVPGHDEKCLYPLFPESEEEEVYTKFYDNPADWETFTLHEAQRIHRLENPIVPMEISDDCLV